MTQEVIDTGELPNDGSGDPLRLAFDKINNNFANLFSLTTGNTEVVELIDPTGTTYSSQQTGGNVNIGNIYITNNYENPVALYNPNANIDPVAHLEALTVPTGPIGEQEYILIGAQPNDGQGDPLRTAFAKINNNFTQLFLTRTNTSSAFTNGLDTNQVIFETPATEFYQGQFQIRSYDVGTPDMQDVTLSASITNNLSGVRFSAYGTLFEGNVLCRYDMDVFDGNVRVLINPLKDVIITHFIASTITYPGSPPEGVPIGLNGYPEGDVLGTEDDFELTTESA